MSRSNMSSVFQILWVRAHMILKGCYCWLIFWSYVKRFLVNLRCLWCLTFTMMQYFNDPSSEWFNVYRILTLWFLFKTLFTIIISINHVHEYKIWMPQTCVLNFNVNDGMYSSTTLRFPYHRGTTQGVCLGIHSSSPGKVS